MMICEPQCGVRAVLITGRRTKVDCAQSLRHLADRYPEADVIRVVLDPLNTHKAASLCEAFPPEEARLLARKREFHYTPKHGGGLNIAEIERAVLSNACLSRRMPDEETLRKEVQANVRERNQKAQPVNGRFTTQDTRRELARLYPSVSG